VSPKAIKLAQENLSSHEPTQHPVEFLAYDAMQLPAPQKPVDFVFDGTVYCNLRWRYLPSLYSLWRRILSPHTVMMLNCLSRELMMEVNPAPPLSTLYLYDIVADLEPVLDILWYERCEKNHVDRGIFAWCVYARLKNGSSALADEVLAEERPTAEQRDESFAHRQAVARVKVIWVKNLLQRPVFVSERFQRQEVGQRSVGPQEMAAIVTEEPDSTVVLREGPGPEYKILAKFKVTDQLVQRFTLRPRPRRRRAARGAEL